MMLPALEPRNAAIVAYYGRGFSLRETAAHFGLSIERVRQIVRELKPGIIRPACDTSNNSTGLRSSIRRSRLRLRQRQALVASHTQRG